MLLFFELAVAAILTGTSTPLKPALIIGGSISERDFPASSRIAGEEAIVNAIFVVGLKGRAENCRVEAPSLSAALDARSCELVGRLRFKPARNVKNKPMVQEFRQVFVWRSRTACPSLGPTDICINVSPTSR
jgi:outer membrane biosynthesis protein TonB